MYGFLGSIRFMGVNAPTSVSSTYGANYVEHPLIEGKPRLQRVGTNLETLDLEIQLLSSFCVPEQELQKLYTLLESTEIVPLIFGSGLVYGNFVVKDVNLTYDRQDPQGRILACTVAVSLLESYNPGDPTDNRSAGFARARALAPVTVPTVTPFGDAAVFSSSITSAAARTVQVEVLMVQIENDPALDVSNLQKIDVALQAQEADITTAAQLANDTQSSIYAAAADFRLALSGIYNAIGTMRNAVNSSVNDALNANPLYQQIMSDLSTLAVNVAALKAIRR